MKKFYVGFSKSKKPFALGSWLIRLYQQTKFSHVYIRLDTNKFPSDKYLHASEGKVQNMSGTQFYKRHEVIDEFEISVTDEIYSLVIMELHEKSGDDYGLLQNLGIIYVDLMRDFFGKKVKNPFQKGWNCSEFVAHILFLTNSDVYNYYDLNSVTPKDLHTHLKKLML